MSDLSPSESEPAGHSDANIDEMAETGGPGGIDAEAIKLSDEPVPDGENAEAPHSSDRTL